MVFHVISIKSGLYYCSVIDRVEGCEYLGEYSCTTNPAQFAMFFYDSVIMLYVEANLKFVYFKNQYKQIILRT